MASTLILESSPPALLALQDVSLSYGSVNALRNVNLLIRPSEIHAMVGEHGAGKSSMAKIASGLLRPKSGRLLFDGVVYGELTAARAHALGIEMVYQETQIFENLTVVEHFFLLPRSGPALPQFLIAKRQTKEVGEFLRALGFSIDPLARLQSLSHTDQMLMEIAKCLFHKPKLLILDEVFERISAFDINRFLPFFRQLKEEGMSVLLVTHKIDDVYEFADTVSIVKDGEVLLTGAVNDIDKMNLITLTYTQISKEEQSKDPGRDFYTYLRYNEAILQFLPVILLVIDREGLVKMINVSACEYFKVSRKEGLKVPFDVLFGSSNGETIDTIRRALTARQKKTFYSVPLLLSERKSVVNLIVYPIRDGSHPIGHMIIIEDLTEQEQLRAQLILSEKLASVGLLAAGVAHEINNPLGIITNYLQSIKFRFSDAELRSRIGQVEEQIQFISAIVSDLLLFSDSGKVVREEINIVEVIRGLISFVQYSFRHSEILITFIEHARHGRPRSQPERDKADHAEPDKEQLRGDAAGRDHFGIGERGNAGWSPFGVRQGARHRAGHRAQEPERRLPSLLLDETGGEPPAHRPGAVGDIRDRHEVRRGNLRREPPGIRLRVHPQPPAAANHAPLTAVIRPAA